MREMAKRDRVFTLRRCVRKELPAWAGRVGIKGVQAGTGGEPIGAQLRRAHASSTTIVDDIQLVLSHLRPDAGSVTPLPDTYANPEGFLRAMCAFPLRRR